jgi:hypothetical protein
MILEIVLVYFIFQCTKMFARLIRRRADVLHYVSASEHH